MTAPILHRTASALTLAAALLAAPALAQDAPAAAPPVIQPVPAPVPIPEAASPAPAVETVAPPPVVATNPQPAAPVAEEPAAPAARAARPAARAVARTPLRSAPVAAPIAAAPIAAAPTVAAPAEPTTAPVAAAPVAAPAAAPAAEPATTTTQTRTSSTAIWPFAAIAALLLAAGAFFFLRSRRRADEEEYWQEGAVEPAYTAPVVAEPTVLATAPVHASVEDHADLVTADAEEVAALASGDAPAGRPWLELSFRPLRAGTVEESALVDVELTIGNAGDVAARDVRVSTFMLGDQSDAPTEMDGLLATHHEGTEVAAGSIEPGAGSRIDATLTVPRESVTGATFSPVVVADVRYTLPNGQEGRTAASFVVGGANEDDTLTPLRNGGDMRDDVSAALHGELERA